MQKTNRTGVIALVSVQIGQYFREKNEKKARALPGHVFREIKIKVVVIHVRQLLILV